MTIIGTPQETIARTIGDHIRTNKGYKAAAEALNITVEEARTIYRAFKEEVAQEIWAQRDKERGGYHPEDMRTL